MPIYSVNTLDSIGVKRTTYRGEEAYITFYRESDYTAGKTRSQMSPVGTYIYCTGIALTESIIELPPLQGLNSRWKNLRAPGCIDSALSITAMYVQEDPTWMGAGHPPLIAYIDFIDSSHLKQSPGDVINANMDYVQTVVVRNVIRQKRAITSTSGNLVAYQVDFSGGEVITLPIGNMDLP